MVNYQRRVQTIPTVILTLVISSVAVLLCSKQIYGDSYATGYQQYIKSDFINAEKSLKKALKTEFKKPEIAKIAKLLGIVQYMRGKKKNAKRSFSVALRHDPQTTITANEVLDDSILDFFSEVKIAVEDELLLKQMQAQEKAYERKALKDEAKNQDDSFLSESKPRKRKSTKKDSRKYSRYYKKNKKSYKRKTKKKPLSIWTFFPFGAGQYEKGANLLGSFFTVSELAAIAGYFYYNTEIDKTIKEENEVARDVESGHIDPKEAEKYYSSNDDFIAGMEQKQKICMALAISLYAAGVIEAVYNRPKIARKKRRRLSDNSLVPFNVNNRSYSRSIEFTLTNNPFSLHREPIPMIRITLNRW